MKLWCFPKSILDFHQGFPPQTYPRTAQREGQQGWGLGPDPASSLYFSCESPLAHQAHRHAGPLNTTPASLGGWGGQHKKGQWVIGPCGGKIMRQMSSPAPITSVSRKKWRELTFTHKWFIAFLPLEWKWSRIASKLGFLATQGAVCVPNSWQRPTRLYGASTGLSWTPVLHSRELYSNPRYKIFQKMGKKYLDVKGLDQVPNCFHG